MPTPETMKLRTADYELPKLPEAGKAIVYIVRPAQLAGIIQFNVFLGDKKVESEMGYTQGEQYIYFNLEPGAHKILSNAENWAEINVTVKAGEVVFIKQEKKWGFLKARNSLIILADYEGMYYVMTLKLGTVIKKDKSDLTVSSQTIENQARNMPWLKWVVALLSFAVVGQVSAMLIPAFNGQLPGVLSLVGSYLWLSLFFMSVWFLRGKRKLDGVLVGIFSSFILMQLTEGVAAYNDELKVMERDQVVENSNKELPKMVDEETRLDMVSIDQGLNNYYFYMTGVNLLTSEADIDFMDENYKEIIIPSACSNSTLQVLLAENYTINYVYKDKLGVPIRTYLVSSKDCI